MPTTTNYIWDDQNYLAESDETNTINVVYTNEPRTYGNLVSTRIGSETSYHHFDALGSTRQLTNAVGHVTDTVIYDAWGNVDNRTGATSISLLWVGIAGYYYDIEVATTWISHRAYRTAIARWEAVDADAMPSFRISIAYAYALNRPVILYDPSGRVPAGGPFPNPLGPAGEGHPGPSIWAPPVNPDVQGMSTGPGVVLCPVSCAGNAGSVSDIGYIAAGPIFLHLNRQPNSFDLPNIAAVANGIGIIMTFNPTTRKNPCCCDYYGFIQVVMSNWQNPKLPPKLGGKPNFVDVPDNNIDGPFNPQGPLQPGAYPGQILGGGGRPISLGGGAGAGLADRPYLPGEIANLAGVDNPTDTFESCVVCRRANLQIGAEDPKSTIMQCVTWGYTLQKNVGANGVVSWTVKSVQQPTCSGTPSAAFISTLVTEYPGFGFLGNNQSPPK